MFIRKNRAYIALGDYQGIIMSFPPNNMESPPLITPIPYKDREHNQEICSNTLAFAKENMVALITANPTQNKDIGNFLRNLREIEENLDKRSEKNNVFLINYDTLEVKKLEPLPFSMFTVPFDFDGSKFL